MTEDLMSSQWYIKFIVTIQFLATHALQLQVYQNRILKTSFYNFGRKLPHGIELYQTFFCFAKCVWQSPGTGTSPCQSSVFTFPPAPGNC